MDTVKIEFTRSPTWEFIEPIVPASQAIPNWYKEAQTEVPGVGVYDKTHVTFKGCPAILDSMLQGYVLPLWADIWVEPGEDGSAPTFRWARGLDSGAEDTALITVHNVISSQGLRLFDELSSAPWTLKLNSPWIVNTPEGYSMLNMPPLNNRDSRFEAVAGVVCTDTFTTYINVPLIWKAPLDYEGIIKRGTPLVQMIPFKREVFQQELGFTTDEGGRLLQRQQACGRGVATHFRNGYKRLFHKTAISK